VFGGRWGREGIHHPAAGPRCGGAVRGRRPRLAGPDRRDPAQGCGVGVSGDEVYAQADGFQ
jgi:hypothetical protein